MATTDDCECECECRMRVWATVSVSVSVFVCKRIFNRAMFTIFKCLVMFKPTTRQERFAEARPIFLSPV